MLAAPLRPDSANDMYGYCARGMLNSRVLRKSVRRTQYTRSYMYAVIKTGGKQYKVAAGEKIKVEQIAADVGQEIVFDQV